MELPKGSQDAVVARNELPEVLDDAEEIVIEEKVTKIGDLAGQNIHQISEKTLET